MYVAKFDRSGFRWEVTLFEKHWSKEMLSNEITEIVSKKFIWHFSGYNWVNKQIAKELFKQHRLEIING